MNKLKISGLIASLVILASCNNAPAIAYINPNKLMQGYHGATAQHDIFQAKAKAWQQRVDSLSIELQALSTAPALAN
ncbi:OmpH family outer membrane protein [Hymenobacter siberiensis]|jgi:Skp family chaperone for outer membrane proteins|uniref:OmpH family outer membrane protein n=1 Tax=Hymenobacter siberiensis TaxID=2848396 RepID=UPI001C1E1362|nr:OmpH family outer membrane protein [Hymenobacter siberiensis]MBU6123385.1 OmpH family outer membrane protein [Hymenobacter siberiensis]